MAGCSSLNTRHHPQSEYWLAHDGKNYNSARVGPRLNKHEVKEMLKTNEDLHCLWDPIDILDESHWLDADDEWRKVLWDTSATWMSNSAESIKAGKAVSMEDSMKWYSLVLQVVTNSFF